MKLLLRSTLFALIACFALPAPAQTGSSLTIWVNSGGTSDFNTSSNWSAGIPNSNVDTYIMPGFISSTASGFQNVVVPGGATTINITSTTDNSSLGVFLWGNFFFTSTNSSTYGTVNLTFNSGTTYNIGIDGVEITGGDTLNFSGVMQDNGGTIAVGDGLFSNSATNNGTFNLLSGSLNYDSNNGGSLIVGDGSTGAFTQGSAANGTSSTVNAGQFLAIGDFGGTGTYTLTQNSVLNIGTFGAPQASFYALDIGETSSSIGTLFVNDNSTVNATNSGTIVILGDGTNAQGTITQSGSSTVNLGGSQFLLGNAAGATGTYNLQSGTLNLTDAVTILGAASGSAGYINQSGGSLVVGPSSAFAIGNFGTGQYNFSGGTADFQTAFTLGGQSATGLISQSGNSTLIAEAAETIGGVGGTAPGIYALQGGTATFNNGLTIAETGLLEQSGGTLTLGSGANSLVVNGGGIITQTGGTLVINTNLGQTLDLSAYASSYNLDGGTLQIGDGGLIGTSGQGTLNFGGGTLQITSGTTFVEPLDGTLSGGTTTIDTSSTPGLNSFTMSGALTGTGGLNFNGTQNTVFAIAPTSGHDSYTGVTSITTGTLFADMADVGQSSSFNMGQNGTFELTVDSGGNFFGGGLTGSGILNLNFSAPGDAFVVAGNSNFTGTTSLNNHGTRGVLQVYNGTFGDITGPGSRLVIGGDSLIPGTPVPTTGTVNLIGTNTFTGGTQVNPGFTLQANNLTGSLTNDGTLATNVGLPSVINTPTFTIGGNLTSTGTIVVNTNGNVADMYQVNGAAPSTVSGKVLLLNGVGTNTYIIVNAPAGLSIGGNGQLNDANGLSSNPPGSLFSVSLSESPDNTQLLLSTNQSYITPFATTPNQRAVAGALDPFTQRPPAAFAPLLSALNNLPASAIPGALDQLSPSSLQYASTISFENANFMAQQLNGALANVRSGYEGIDGSGLRVVNSGFDTNLGTSLGSLLAYNAPSFNKPAPNGVNYYPQDESSTPVPQAASPIAPSSHSISDSPNSETTVPPTTMASSNPDFKGPHLSEFILGNVVLADVDANKASSNPAPSKASYTAGNMMAGVSFRMTSNIAAGVLFDYNHTDANTDSNGSKTQVDSYSPGIFATYFEKGFFANGLFSYGYNTYSNSRNIPFLGKTATSSPDGQQYVVNGDFGYDYQPRNHREWVFGPNLGLTYTHLDVNSFTETGANPADLAVASQSVDSFRSRLGAHVVYQARSGAILFQPNASLMWQHEYLDQNTGITSSFPEFSSAPFTIQAASPNTDSALIGVGLTATLDNSMAFYFNYLADVGATDFFAQSFAGGFKASF